MWMGQQVHRVTRRILQQAVNGSMEVNEMNANAGVVLTLCWLLSLPSMDPWPGPKTALAIQSVQ
jgi:hypothetical protein